MKKTNWLGRFGKLIEDEDEKPEDLAEEPQLPVPTDQPQTPDQPPQISEDQKPKAKAEKVFNLIDELYFGTAEKTFKESAYDADSQYAPYNPDDIYQKAGDYSIYEDMLKDDQISVCMSIKKDLVLGSGWDIVCEYEDELHTAIKKDIEKALTEDPKVPFDDQLQEILCAYEFGFSLSEKVFQNRPDGTLSLKWLRTRHPSTWLIHTDDYGKVEKYEQRGRTESIDIDPKSLIHYVNNPKFQNPYGQSDLRAAYNAWFVKRQIIRFYGIFLEKAASPIPVAKYDPNITQKDARDDIHDAIKKFQTKTALTIPKNIEVEFLEAKNSGDVFIKGINIFNMFIGRSLFIPDLMGFQGGETSGGSYSLGKDQMEVLFKHIERRRATLELLINKEIIKPLVIYNWGFVDHFPKFKLRPISDTHLIELAKLWVEVVKGKIYAPSEEELNHFRKLAKFPQASSNQIQSPLVGAMPGQDPTAVGNPAQVTPTQGIEQQPQQLPVEEPIQDGQLPNEVEEEEYQEGLKEGQSEDQEKPETQEDQEEQKEEGDDPKSTNPSDAPTTSVPLEPKAIKPEAKGEKKQFKLYNLPSGSYHRKVNFKAIESQMDRFKDRILSEALPVVKNIFEDLFDQIEQKKILQNQKAEKLEDLKLKYLKDLKLILKRNLREAYTDGKLTGQKELLKGNFRTPLPDDAFLDVLEAETFQFIGDWAYNVTKSSRIAILEAIKDGKPLSAVLDLLDDQGISEGMASLERYSKTKITEVMNRGRLAFFNESSVVSAYQYAAVLDDRTSPICEGLHGKIFKAGTEPVPPMHFNCRSLLVPITKFEDFEVDDKVGRTPIDEFIEENKGDGFSKR